MIIALLIALVATNPGYAMNIVQKSWAPDPPHIWKVEETTAPVGDVPGAQIVVPSVRIVFSRSGEDKASGNPSTVKYYYRLWKVGKGSGIKLNPVNPLSKTDKYDLARMASGELDGKGITDPKAETDTSGKKTGSGLFQFNILLPSSGLNQYRIDCVRLNGDGTRLSAIDINSTEFTNKLKPWLSGFLDNPTTFDPLGRLGRKELNPGEGFLRGDITYEVSALSPAGSVYVSGQGSGLSQFGKIDLTADPKDNSKVYLSMPGFRTADMPSSGTGSIFRYDGKTAQIGEFSRPGFKTPGQAGLAIDSNFNLYTDNSASDADYGGRLFRIKGFRQDADGAYTPLYPSPQYTDGKDHSKDAVPGRLFVGSVNYYSQLISRANPVVVGQTIMGKKESDQMGEQLFVAEVLTNTIKKVAVQSPEINNWDPWHTVGQTWAWSDENALPPLAPENKLNFTGITDLAFNGAKTKLFITQGSYIVQTTGGANKSSSITSNGTIFTDTTGVAVCEDAGNEYLFVSDGAEGRILRIPLNDIPIAVPADAQQRQEKILTYTFMDGLNRPRTTAHDRRQSSHGLCG